MPNKPDPKPVKPVQLSLHEDFLQIPLNFKPNSQADSPHRDYYKVRADKIAARLSDVSSWADDDGELYEQ